MLSAQEKMRLRAEGNFPSQAEWEELSKRSRLSLASPLRIPLASGLSFVVGLLLGTAQGSKMAGLRFRAEHAHKLPETTTGWYLYHKSKNYHVAYGGIAEGIKMGGKVAFWTTAMLSIENMFDSYRGTADVLNTVTSCVAVAGGFSLWSKESSPVHVRIILINSPHCRSILIADGCSNHQDCADRWVRLRRVAGRSRRGEGTANWIYRIPKATARRHDIGSGQERVWDCGIGMSKHPVEAPVQPALPLPPISL